MLALLSPFYNMPYTTEDRYLTTSAYLYQQQLFQTLDSMIVIINEVVLTSFNATTESYDYDGLIAPSKTTAEITTLEPDSQDGTIWFNTTLSKLQVKTAAGTVETITSV